MFLQVSQTLIYLLLMEENDTLFEIHQEQFVQALALFHHLAKALTQLVGADCTSSTIFGQFLMETSHHSDWIIHLLNQVLLAT